MEVATKNNVSSEMKDPTRLLLMILGARNYDDFFEMSSLSREARIQHSNSVFVFVFVFAVPADALKTVGKKQKMSGEFRIFCMKK